MSDSREIWFVRRRYLVQNYPVTWQGWAASLLFSIFLVAMIALAVIVASAVFVVAIVALVVAGAIGFLILVFNRSAAWRPGRNRENDHA